MCVFSEIPFYGTKGHNFRRRLLYAICCWGLLTEKSLGDACKAISLWNHRSLKCNKKTFGYHTTYLLELCYLSLYILKTYFTFSNLCRCHPFHTIYLENVLFEAILYQFGSESKQCTILQL